MNDRDERELAEELRSHLDMHSADNERAGMRVDEARRKAVLALGGVEQTKERYRQSRRARVVEELAQDLRFGCRTLVRNPVLAGTIVFILALATGATTAIFSVVNGVLLRPLPFAVPEQLTEVSLTVPARGLDEVRRQNRAFENFTSYTVASMHLRTANGTERVRTVIADGGFFATLGVEPIVGRTFRRDDPRFVAVLSGRLWSRQFNRDPGIVGGVVALGGETFTVLGVMSDTFQFPYGAASVIGGALPESQTDIWIAEYRQPVGGRVREVTARLKPGITREQAAAEWTGIQNRIDALNPSPMRERLADVRVVPLAQAVLAPTRRTLWLMFGAVALVLVAACANVASLLLAQTSARAREVATRAAIGASHTRLVRQFLAESLLLSFIGGAGGMAIAQWSTSAMVALGSARVPRAEEITLSWEVFAFVLALCVVTALLFGLAPARMAARADLQSVTRETGGHSTSARRYGRIRDLLVVAEMALAFVLAFGVGVVMTELRRLRDADMGMTTANVIALHLAQPTTTPSEARQYYEIADRVARIPGVVSAGFTQALPLQNWGWTANTIDFTRPGRLPLQPPPSFGMELRYVTPGYFHALGIPVLKGRGFTAQDTSGAPRVILINRTLARRYFGDADPVGVDTTRGTIAGIVGDVRQVNLDQPAVPELYYPMSQNWAQLSELGMSLVVRTEGRPEVLIDAIRSTVREINSAMAIFDVKTMGEVIADSLWDLHLYRWLVGLFAAVALVLAAAGLYGVVSYSAAIRGREWGVRLALGSEPAALAGLVLRRGLSLSAAGIAIGAATAVVVGLSAPVSGAALGAKPAMVAAIAALLMVVAFLASVLPALRVARIAPAAVLRQD